MKKNYFIILLLLLFTSVVSISHAGATVPDACQAGKKLNGRLIENKAVCLPNTSGNGQVQMSFHVDSDKIGKSLEILLRHGRGNGTLLQQHNRRPTSSVYDSRSNNAGIDERIVVSNVKGSWNYIHVQADGSSFSNATLLVRYIDKPPATGISNACLAGDNLNGRLIENKAVCLPNTSGNGQVQMSFHVDSDKIGKSLEILLSHGRGNGTLLQQHNRRPTSSVYDNRSNNAGIDERIVVSNVKGSWNYIHVQADGSSFSNVTLLARYIDDNSCDVSIDTDGDRLPDCYETNTGKYSNLMNTGTDPGKADTDGDGINDGDEVMETRDGLNLPAMGVSPVHKDILIEYDWMNDRYDSRCGFHTHKPKQFVIDLIKKTYANAPVTNPDGRNGINIIQDYGQGGVFNGGNLVADSNGVLVGTVFDTEYLNHKNNNFAFNRNGYFHYLIFSHLYDVGGPNEFSSGFAEINGDDIIVSSICGLVNFNQNTVANDRALAQTVMHELGHNLSLRHAGNANLPHRKINYNSVMNYRYQFSGVDSDQSCDAKSDAIADYSNGDRLSLDETNLDENRGVCGNVAIDFNQDGVISTGVAANVSSAGDGFSVLTDHDDWSNINYLGINDSTGASVGGRKTSVSCQLIPAINP